MLEMHVDVEEANGLPCVTARSSARSRNAAMTDSTAKLAAEQQPLAELVSQWRIPPRTGALKVGVDPGTANIAVVVLDENDNPVAGISHPSRAVKDGGGGFLTASRW